MYMVVSKWSARGSFDADLESKSKQARMKMRAMHGVVKVQHCRSDEKSAIAVVTYSSKAAYDALMAPGGAFEQMARTLGLEALSEWQWSERGELADE